MITITENQTNSFSLLNFNFVSLPLFSKNLRKRLNFLTREIVNLQPDVICFQEVWLSYVKRKIMSCLKPLDYHFIYPSSRFFFNGLLSCSKGEILSYGSKNLKPIYNGFNLSLVEFMGSKGYLLVKVHLSNRSEFFVVNVHLNCNWGDKYEIGSKYSNAQVESLKEVAKIVNSLGKRKIIVAGDLNIRSNFYWFKEFMKLAGIGDIVPHNYQTTLPSLFWFKMPVWGRTDYIFTKNFSPEEISDVRLLWDKPLEGVGQLSDHAPLLATFKL